jgi:hypothetical protein
VTAPAPEATGETKGGEGERPVEGGSKGAASAENSKGAAGSSVAAPAEGSPSTTATVGKVRRVLIKGRSPPAPMPSFISRRMRHTFIF